MRKRMILKALKICRFPVIYGTDFSVNGDYYCIATLYIACGVMKLLKAEVITNDSRTQ